MRPSMIRCSPHWWLVPTVVAATHAFAQAGVAVPVGRNLHDRPDSAGDAVLEINNAGTYTLNGRSVVAAQLVGQLAALMSRTRDRVVYISADARLPSAAIDSTMALAEGGDVCVAAFVGMQHSGTVSLLGGGLSPGQRR